MTWTVRFTPLADDDVMDAYGLYEAARRGLGEEFLGRVEDALQVLREFPEAGPLIHAELRRALLHQFPYSLYYRPIMATTTIEVRGCIHQRRHPRTWRRRA